MFKILIFLYLLLVIIPLHSSEKFPFEKYLADKILFRQSFFDHDSETVLNFCEINGKRRGKGIQRGFVFLSKGSNIYVQDQIGLKDQGFKKRYREDFKTGQDKFKIYNYDPTKPMDDKIDFKNGKLIVDFVK
ncbi:hypothetical protein DFA_07639 [Cavenderia fasciculata]|uniref:Uncharacterized protein n=1 Tax=Cavenderia fasciculata TaxID=261658 RepID=F4Q2I2_CACFS|nr:uncharacterized protein DFA_07639 [Cavenderia fasciculata]EGG16661.1 hypothetical protein DFA_07639 [Cavenderia fasciculata]|eukprot:XP_004355135.1 hypothetical protein DFA_07639 [Cavenderia fasciculata]